MKPSSFDSNIAFANDCSILDMWNRQDAILGELSTLTRALSTAKLDGDIDSDFFWHLHLRIMGEIWY